MGKYKKLVGMLPEWQHERNEEIAEIREHYKDKSLEDLSEVLDCLTETKKDIAKQEKGNNLEIEAVTREIRQRLDDSGMEKASFSNGTLSIVDTPKFRVTDHEALNNWLYEKDMQSLIQTRVQPKTLEATLKPLLLDGEELPPGVDVTLVSKAKLTRRNTDG